MATENLHWNGPAISEKLRRAQIEGVNATMGACVNRSKRSHTWRNRTGILEGGITIVSYAARDGNGVRGEWGVTDVRYALIHELGGIIRPVKSKALAIPQPDGSVRFVRQVTIPARPYLRPSADVEYPLLGGRIKRTYERSGTSTGGSDG